MNIIKVVDDKIEQFNINDNIKLEYYEKESLFAINEIRLNVEKKSNLEIYIEIKDDTKLNFNINVLNGSKLNLKIVTSGNNGKIKYNYNIYKDANVDVFKYQDVNSIKEMISIKLKEENSKINYNLKTISDNKETYDYNIYHDANNTDSIIKNNSVCVDDGIVLYQVSAFVPKDVRDCIVNQNNRIINLTNNKCEIMPNLYIDSKDVTASHSALIGKFSDEEMFYIQSRGISYDDALKLLIKGFLTSDLKDRKMLKEINKNINKHWR